MNKRNRSNLIWGTILTVIGLLFLLENVGVDAWEIIFKLWPLILIFWGASKLYYGIKEKKAEKQAEATVEVLKEDQKDES
jgi:membrane protein DedA with SNARE-associated domain